jgi:ankyrin repeat protein
MGADVNVKDDNGWTALMRAADKRHKDIVKLLLEKGTDINVKDGNGWTALMRAAANEHEVVVELVRSRS